MHGGKKKNHAQEEWEADALAYLHAYPVLRALVITEKNFDIKWRLTLKNLRPITYQSIASDQQRKEAIDLAVKTGKSQMTDFLTFTQGGMGYLYICPLFVDNKYSGIAFSILPH